MKALRHILLGKGQPRQPKKGERPQQQQKEAMELSLSLLRQ